MQLIKYQCRKCRYIFVKLHPNDNGQKAACPRCHHQNLIVQADFTAIPLKDLVNRPACTEHEKVTKKHNHSNAY